MIRHRLARLPLAGVAIAACCLPLGGCIFNDIHEEIVRTNERLDTLEQQLDLVREANTLLATGNDELDAVQTELGTVQQQLSTLESIDTSLKRLDEHLAALRATINNIDSSIPFLKISGDPDDIETEDETDADTAENATDAPASPEEK
jgi:uncharacterized protein YoxC